MSTPEGPRADAQVTVIDTAPKPTDLADQIGPLGDAMSKAWGDYYDAGGYGVPGHEERHQAAIKATDDYDAAEEAHRAREGTEILVPWGTDADDQVEYWSSYTEGVDGYEFWQADRDDSIEI